MGSAHPPAADGTRHSRLALPAALLCAATFLLALGLYSRHSGMPYWWHGDEPGKVAQVTGERALNFKHPLLLMNATRGLSYLTGADRERQAAVRVGRFVSASFGALAVAALVALAWLQRGLAAAACAAPILLLSHALFDFSHFMKEDTALVFGVSLTLLAGSWLVRRPGPASAAGLGAACGLALSAKYVGAVVLLGALPILLLRLRGDARWSSLVAFGAGFVATLLVVNASVLLHFDSFRAGLAYETGHATTGGRKDFSGVWSLSYLTGLESQAVRPVRQLAIGWILYVIVSWRRRSLDERIVALFPVLFLALLQLSPIKAIRYLLPAVVVAHLLAGLAVVALADASGRLLPRLVAFTRSGAAAPSERARLAVRLAVAASLLLFLLVPEGRRIREHLDAFANDSRFALYAWVRDHVPWEHAIVQDRYAGLPDPVAGFTAEEQPELAPWVVTRHYALDYGSVDELRAKGFQWVAVCDRIYEPLFLTERGFGSEATRRSFETRRDRYAELFERGTLVFEAGDSSMSGVPVNPEIRLYRLAPR